MCLYAWEYLRTRGVIGACSSLVLIALGSLILASMFYGTSMQASFGIIDDHEIALYLGSDHRITLGEIIPQLLSTEVGEPGTSLRYRPAYYLVRLLEAWAWGDNVAAWYGFRLVILAAFLGVCWRIAAAYWGIFFSGMAMVNLLRLTFWSDLFARLGPAETYAVLGLALCLGGFFLLANNLRREITSNSRLSWLLLCVGCALCAGVKENFIPLIFPVLYIARRYRSSAQWGTFQSVALMLTLVWVGFIAVAVSTSLLKSKVDVYANSIRASDRGVELIRAVVSPESIMVVGLAAAGIGASRVVKKASHKKNALTYAKLSLGTWLVIVSQYVFYNGNWPTGTRYDFPGVFVLAVFCLATLHYAGAWLRLQNFSALRNIGRFIAVLVVLLTASGNYAHAGERVASTIRETQAFTQTMEAVSRLILSHPQENVLIEVGDYSQYEPAVSYARFLPFYQVENPLYLSVALLPEPGRESSFDQAVYLHLQSISKQGMEAVLPLSQLLASTKPCVSIQLAADSTGPCTRIASLQGAQTLWIER